MKTIYIAITGERSVKVVKYCIILCGMGL